ncbi:MAG: DUF6790 family protein [Rhodospirillales bacterium]
MYFAIVLVTMVVAPLVCIGAELATATGVGELLIVATRWFVFWAVGVRLLLAGVSQIMRPGFTTKAILGVDEPQAYVLAQELGFANTAIGLAGVLSIVFSIWALPIAFVGGVFFGLAGLNHLRRPQRNRRENIAMITDLWAAVILLAIFALSLLLSVEPTL